MRLDCIVEDLDWDPQSIAKPVEVDSSALGTVASISAVAAAKAPTKASSASLVTRRVEQHHGEAYQAMQFAAMADRRLRCECEHPRRDA